ncbi:hypothetical protein DYBT9275_00816 [Dyadobacter sp. CECT 9275]|uniref:THUMP-like domain-containing protein n=1 Tax=Dyadobacter helix TaxID=2822344 RepID=A0A916N4I0_9BACT|nr:hypothetical protein [Dyadobacter sp. CECT 9275]CAG4991712.1 hypothetical protein DYBT9275_00816 [Dyadobacter sp. CECT 9275]
MQKSEQPEPLPVEPFTSDEIEFIRQHIQDDVNQLILRSSIYKNFDIKKLGAQILSRQKAQKKLPEWYDNPVLIFPPPLSIEQSSSEATAKYKSGMIQGRTLMDITGGMGIDSYYLSRSFNKTLYFERNEEVSRCAAYNFEVLKASNISVHTADSIDYIHQKELKSDWIFADPARRGTQQEKVVLLSDCTPDIAASLKTLYAAASNILIKTSPLLDIDLAVKELKGVKEVHIIGLGNECKELLFVLDQENNQPDFLRKVRVLDSRGDTLAAMDFSAASEQQALPCFSDPLSFLYEPHAAVLKAGFYRLTATHFNLNKLAASSHLYTSENCVPNFPGRVFEILAVCKPDIREITKYIGGDKANLTIRNFPGTVHDLRKKWRLKEGGDFYLFATTLTSLKRVVIVTRKISFETH